MGKHIAKVYSVLIEIAPGKKPAEPDGGRGNIEELEEKGQRTFNADLVQI